MSNNDLSGVIFIDFNQRQLDAYRIEVKRLTKGVNVPALINRFIIEAAITVGILQGIEKSVLPDMKPSLVAELADKIIKHINDAYTVPSSLIIQAADCVTDRTKKVPKELLELWECKMWNTLPSGNSLEDIPVKKRIRTYEANHIYQSVMNWHRYSKDDKWLADNMDIPDLLDYIDKLKEQEEKK